MGNEQHCALGKPAPQGGLHLELRPRVHGGRGLIQDEDLGFPEKGTCQTQELLLAETGNEWNSQAPCLCARTSGFAGCAHRWAPTTVQMWWGMCTWVPSVQSW